MDNFSAWIRIQILAFDNGGESLEDAIRQRAYWKAKYEQKLEEWKEMVKQ
jgi:hypothetical protein